MANLVLPIRIDFNSWATQLLIDLPTFDIPYPDEEDEWWDWASQIITRNKISNIPVPTKKIYKNKEDWAEWASFFIISINNE